MDHIEILFKEYDTLRKQVVSRISNWYQLAGAFAITVGWLLSRPPSMGWLGPVAGLTFAALVFGGTLARDIHICAARLQELEVEINKLAGAELLKWETHYGVAAYTWYFWRKRPTRKQRSSRVFSYRTIPNALTAFRFVLIIPFVWLALHGRDMEAFAVFAIAGTTDLVDGILARWLHQTSTVGRLADPLADKLLTSAAFFALSVFRAGLSAIPFWVMAAVILRDVFILLGCLVIYRSTRNAGFKPTIFGKANTLIEFTVVGWFLSSTSLPAVAPALPLLYVLLVLSILASAASYVVQGLRMISAARRPDPGSVGPRS
jgi:cardiolipin synthase (CMP-forming)